MRFTVAFLVAFIALIYVSNVDTSKEKHVKVINSERHIYLNTTNLHNSTSNETKKKSSEVWSVEQKADGEEKTITLEFAHTIHIKPVLGDRFFKKLRKYIKRQLKEHKTKRRKARLQKIKQDEEDILMEDLVGEGGIFPEVYKRDLPSERPLVKRSSSNSVRIYKRHTHRRKSKKPSLKEILPKMLEGEETEIQLKFKVFLHM